MILRRSLQPVGLNINSDNHGPVSCYPELGKHDSNFDRSTAYGFLLPPSGRVLPQRHLAAPLWWKVVMALDLSELVKAYRDRLGLLSPGDAVSPADVWLCDEGVFQPALDRATYDSWPFRFHRRNEHPDHDTIAAFRKRFHPDSRCLSILSCAHDRDAQAPGTRRHPNRVCCA